MERNDDKAEIIVCAGPPTCLLQDEAAVEQANSGCQNCRHILVHADGTESEYRIQSN